MRIVVVISALIVGLSSQAMAQSPPKAASTPIATTLSTSTQRIGVLVEIAAPRGVTRPMIEAGMERSKPTYQAIPGLIRKYFTIGADGSFGGIYLWTDRTSAQNWFGPTWRARVISTYGSEPKVTYFDVPIVLDGMAKNQ